MRKGTDYTIEEATRVIAHLNDFCGETNGSKVQAWKDAFYELWRYQMTWGYAHEIAVSESRQTGVFVDILVTGESYLESLLSSMEVLGFRNIKTYKEEVAIIDGFMLDELVAAAIVE